jgi:hypothetical protein
MLDIWLLFLFLVTWIATLCKNCETEAWSPTKGQKEKASSSDPVIVVILDFLRY